MNTDLNIIKYIIVFICGLAQVLLSLPAGASPGFDHQEAAAHSNCGVCHAAAATAPALLSVNAGQWCVTCHSKQAANVHPMGIPASMSSNLPFEPGGRIGCLTCHSPHQVAIASEAWVAGERRKDPGGLFLTYLLPFPNTSGELCKRCHEDPSAVMRGGSIHRPRSFESRGYAGSVACASCHAEIYKEWYLTPHARMTRKPADVHDLPALSGTDLEWPSEHIRYVLGSHYVHRFVAEASGTLVVLPRILDRATKKWLPVRDYGWTKRRWLEQCAGCHTTGFTSDGDTFVESGVGCEACHGPARDHAHSGAPELVANPAKMVGDRAEMVCMSCHTSGVDESPVTGESVPKTR
ncbi:MAG TPA: cytochrome c3 family protein, partial [Candidatus Ozemobacteraceae bacterium]|nr:cytochrome c3 family protein [Candidatus Ozemobacteraceae bacterium]